MVIKLVIHLFLLVTFADLPKKSRTSEGSSFGSSAIFNQDPPLSVSSLQRDWLYRESHWQLFFINFVPDALKCQYDNNRMQLIY